MHTVLAEHSSSPKPSTKAESSQPSSRDPALRAEMKGLATEAKTITKGYYIYTLGSTSALVKAGACDCTTPEQCNNPFSFGKKENQIFFGFFGFPFPKYTKHGANSSDAEG